MKFVLSTLLAAAALPALADVGASASLTGLRYELVDLNPNDGVTPYVKLTGQSFVQAFWGNYCSGSGLCGELGSFTTPASWSFGNDMDNGSASVSQAGLFASTRTSSSRNGFAAAAGPDVMPMSSGSSGIAALARYQGVLGQPLFVLSANTALRITGQYTLDAFAEPFRSPGPLLRGQEYAGASVFFRSRFIEGTAPFIRISAVSDWQSPSDYAHETGEVSVLMRNDLDHQATLWGKWGVTASSAIPSVPEPSTYALMLAGVGVVGWAAKRRPAAARKD